ncbi:hypothetical protein EGM88_11105 [Aureibaculum marinum]|uniref:Uncharacterized protein n=2 Tax=Aureibaculum marinum TaxID=2487930 RepID=A0A3N4NSE4_9FLAO|nr:hypothetical protein EGM88_11105 [Aureibaculum marinum]
MPTFAEEEVINRFNNLSFLVGDFNISVYSYNLTKGWIQSGKGNSECKIEETFITEKVKLNKEDCNVCLNNTIAFDVVDSSYRLMSFDKTLGSVDVYKGTISNETIIFNNLDSEYKTKNKLGEDISFKLIYKRLSATENELVVGYTKNKGRTWFPFVKNIYTRK